MLEREPPDEIRLVHAYAAREADAGGRGVEIGVLPDDDMALLQPQESQGIEPVRHETVRLPRRHECIPQCGGLSARVVQLEAQLADESHAQREARYAGDDDLADATIWKALRIDGIAGQALEQIARPWSRDVDRARRRRDVGDMHG